MFVLANGAFKSGSNWLQAIVMAMGKFEGVPYEYSSRKAPRGPWLASDKVKPFLESKVYTVDDYISKGHFFSAKHRDLFLAYDDVYIFNIKRNLGDTLVSHYYHLIRQNKFHEDYAKPEKIKEGFNRYYWRMGRYKAQQILFYHSTWGIASPKIYTSSFEALKDDFEKEAKGISQFLGLNLSDEGLQHIKEKTSLSSMQKVRGQDKLEEHKRFFRKGLVGEWKNHFSDEAFADLQNIQQRGFGPVDMIRYRAIFKVLDVRRRVMKLTT